MIGNEQTHLRENIFAMIARKSGDAPMKITTYGEQELADLLHSQFHSLPELQLAPVQNPDGSFPLMAGWDIHHS